MNRYNEAQVQLNRLRLEVAILGPDWAGDHALNVENAATAIQVALRTAEQSQNQPAFAALLSAMETFRDERTKLIKAATAKYQPERATPEAPGADQPEESQPNL